MLNASLGQPAHFQVYLHVTLSPLTAAATSDFGCSAIFASTKMSCRLLCVFMSDPTGTAAHMTHALVQQLPVFFTPPLHPPPPLHLSPLHHTSSISHAALQSFVPAARPPKLCCSPQPAKCQSLFDIPMSLNVQLQYATDMACVCSLIVCCPRWSFSSCRSDCSTGKWLCSRSAPTNYMRSLAVSHKTHCCCLSNAPV